MDRPQSVCSIWFPENSNNSVRVGCLRAVETRSVWFACEKVIMTFSERSARYSIAGDRDFFSQGLNHGGAGGITALSAPAPLHPNWRCWVAKKLPTP